MFVDAERRGLALEDSRAIGIPGPADAPVGMECRPLGAVAELPPVPGG